jgi:ABC-2 type transport system permease protein
MKGTVYAVAWRGLHNYFKNPALLFPSLIFPLVFLAAFAGGLSALGDVPGFSFPAGYTAFQFVFVLIQTAAFGGVFTGFAVAMDFENGWSPRIMLGASDRRGILLGYVIVGLARMVFSLAVITCVALLVGMRITGNGVDLFGLFGLAVLVNLTALLWACGVAMRFRSIQAGPLMQTPIFLILFLAPVYVPLPLLSGWIKTVAKLNPATAFLEAGRGLISGVHSHTAIAFVAAAVLVALFGVWALRGLRSAERAGV